MLYPVHQVTTTLGRQVTALAKPTFAETTASPALGLFRLHRCPTVFWDQTWFICKKTHCWFPCFPPWKTTSLIDLTVQISSKAGSEEISWNIYVKSHGFYPELFGYLIIWHYWHYLMVCPENCPIIPENWPPAPSSWCCQMLSASEGCFSCSRARTKSLMSQGLVVAEMSQNPVGSWGLWHLIYIYIRHI